MCASSIATPARGYVFNSHLAAYAVRMRKVSSNWAARGSNGHARSSNGLARGNTGDASRPNAHLISCLLKPPALAL